MCGCLFGWKICPGMGLYREAQGCARVDLPRDGLIPRSTGMCESGFAQGSAYTAKPTTPGIEEVERSRMPEPRDVRERIRRRSGFSREIRSCKSTPSCNRSPFFSVPAEGQPPGLYPALLASCSDMAAGCCSASVTRQLAGTFDRGKQAPAAGVTTGCQVQGGAVIDRGADNR